MEARAVERMERSGSGHLVAASLAVILSLTMHAGFIYEMWGVRLNLPAVSLDKQVEARRAETIRVLEVRRESASRAVREGTGQQGRMPAALDLVLQAAKLGRPAEAAPIQPPAMGQDRLAAEAAPLVEPSPAPVRSAALPRQEILMIENRIAADEAIALERREIPDVVRVALAPDIVMPEPMTAEVGTQAPRSAAAATVAVEAPSPAAIEGLPTAEFGAPGPAVEIGEPKASDGSGLLTEAPADVSSLKPIETLLVIDVETYAAPRDEDYRYFRLRIDRAGEAVLPVLPKDVLLVQDCSASIAEQRLYFCRQGLAQCLGELAPGDRFNVVSFRETVNACFESWAPNGPEAVNAAMSFVGRLTSAGNTDLFGSLVILLEKERTPGRPVVALLVSDGRVTAGLTRSSDIIAEFSKLNGGAISVFAIGTCQTANAYLLDLLSYGNRGDATIVESGRWDIPAVMENKMREVSRPVLSDVGCRFSGDAGIEVYPVQSSNLYLDRGLVLYGRYPVAATNLVFQAVGQAGDVRCDMIFQVNLREARKSDDKAIRFNWASQKIYNLISRYARQRDPAVLDEMVETSDGYRVRIPYRRGL